MVTDFTETTVSLSWRTGGDGFTPITSIEILVTPERGDPPSTNPIILPPTNLTVITELLPFRAHEFSVAVRNMAGTSDRRNITASTRSLRKYLVHVHVSCLHLHQSSILSLSLVQVSLSLPFSLSSFLWPS